MSEYYEEVMRKRMERGFDDMMNRMLYESFIMRMRLEG